MRANGLPHLGRDLSAIVLVRIAAPHGDFNVCSGTENIVHEGITYQATGTLGSIEALSEKHGTEISRLSLGLHGLPPASFAVFAADKLRGCPCKVLLHVSSGGRTSAIPVFSGQVNQATFSPLPSMSVSITVGGRLALLRKALASRYTDADQQAHFPGDKGLAFVADLEHLTLTWGN